jgi:hypothetical protein
VPSGSSGCPTVDVRGEKRSEAPTVNSPARERGVQPHRGARPEGPAHPLLSVVFSAAPSALISALCLSRPHGRAYSLPALRAWNQAVHRPLDALSGPVSKLNLRAGSASIPHAAGWHRSRHRNCGLRPPATQKLRLSGGTDELPGPLYGSCFTGAPWRYFGFWIRLRVAAIQNVSKWRGPGRNYMAGRDNCGEAPDRGDDPLRERPKKNGRFSGGRYDKKV